MSLGCLWKLLCLEIQLWKALLKVGSVILLCCSALRLKHLLLPAARDKYVILQAKVKVSLLRASPQPSCISSTPLQVEEGLMFLSACPSDTQKPLLVSCHFSVFSRSSFPLVFPALPGVPQSPAVTSLQPLAAPPCVLIWPIVVNPEVPFLGQLHLIPPTPLPSLNNNWHSVLTQCQAFHRSRNSQKPGRGAEVPTVACAATCATPDNTGEEASQTHAAPFPNPPSYQ